MATDAELQKDFTIVDKARLYTQRAFLQPFGIILLCFFIGHFSGMTTLQTYAVQVGGLNHFLASFKGYPHTLH